MSEKRNAVRRIAALAAFIFGWLNAGSALAQDFCSDLRSLLRAAPSEFGSHIGAPVEGAWPAGLTVFQGTLQLSGASGCAVAQQTSNGRRTSTSYTCSNAGADDAAGLIDLRQRIASCVNVTAWTEQTANGALSAQYGLLRLSITRNGAHGGLALGVEVFRDQSGAILGSPMRGDVVRNDGTHSCSSKTPEEIADLFAMYGQRPGAEPFEDERFTGFRNSLTQPVVAFMTKPTHPAHPAIIARSVTERDGSNYISASGDFAGDCQAFLTLIGQVNEMNQSLGRTRR